MSIPVVRNALARRLSLVSQMVTIATVRKRMVAINRYFIAFFILHLIIYITFKIEGRFREIQKVASTPIPRHTGSGWSSVTINSRTVLTIRQVQLAISNHFIEINLVLWSVITKSLNMNLLMLTWWKIIISMLQQSGGIACSLDGRSSGCVQTISYYFNFWHQFGYFVVKTKW